MTITVTTSWDDGHVLDLRVAELLDRYHLTGTFYIARDFLPERMSEHQLRELAQRHEIGAHTLTHPVLTEVSHQQAHHEIHGSKHWLQAVLGQEVTAFCYPIGANNPDIQRIVAGAGYVMARTVDKFALATGHNVYAVPTTLQIYPYPLRSLPDIALMRGWKTRLQPLLETLPVIRTHHLSLKALLNWQALADSLLQVADSHNAVWHLWGHSWEVEKYGLWTALEAVLATVRRYNVEPVTNTTLAMKDMQ